MPLGKPELRALPRVAAHVDAVLYRIDHGLSWLVALSPIDNDAMWAAFQASGCSAEPSLRYPALPAELHGLRAALNDLPVDGIEHPLLENLLREKQTELSRLLDLMEQRESSGFIATSTELFGDCEPTLLAAARTILERTPRTPDALDDEDSVDGAAIAEAAEAALQRLRADAPDLLADVEVVPDLGSLMMVNHGQLYVARSARLSRRRADALLAHEIGTHVVTHYNGSRQPLKQLEVGLASYDTLQEGLAAFSEYLAGNLSPERLRVLAARVLAVDMALAGAGVVAICAALTEDHGFRPSDAFDVAVRARRGGGLTKDLAYLRGLLEVHAHVRAGQDLAPLFLGKFSFHHQHVLTALKEHGWVRDPVLLPPHVTERAGQRRLEEARKCEITDLYQLESGP